MSMDWFEGTRGSWRRPGTRWRRWRRGGARDELMGDWRQANWEVVVEGLLPVGTRLVIYGDGAD